MRDSRPTICPACRGSCVQRVERYQTCVITAAAQVERTWSGGVLACCPVCNGEGTVMREGAGAGVEKGGRWN